MVKLSEKIEEKKAVKMVMAVDNFEGTATAPVITTSQAKGLFTLVHVCGNVQNFVVGTAQRPLLCSTGHCVKILVINFTRRNLHILQTAASSAKTPTMQRIGYCESCQSKPGFSGSDVFPVRGALAPCSF